MIIHISRDRFQSILNQSYRLGTAALSDDPHVRVERPDEITDYHLLTAEEEEQCPVCGKTERSVAANSPVDLEILKTSLRAGGNHVQPV